MLAALAALDLVASVAFAQPAIPQSKSVSVAKIVSSIPEGQTWGRLGYSLGCIYSMDLAWNVGRGRLNVSAFEQPIRVELERDGYSVAGDAADPFGQEKTADIAIGGVITHISGQFCEAYVANGVYGSASIDMDWQIYSKIERKVIGTVHTQGQAKSATASSGGFTSVLIAAMTENARTLGASGELKTLATSRSTAAGPVDALEATHLVLSGSILAKPVAIADAVGSVVLILSGDGHGSGFLVSSDGYVMTAQHVVGTDKYVKIRWSDGIEGVGEVVRSDKRRDVALVKVDPRGRQPLALHRAAPQPGDTVFAVGAPLDEKFQSTVTRGVASANRIQDGFSFIQSDVTINPGNSGGPLLDEKGEVLGICDLAYGASEESHTGINYFVPIADALLFLKAEPR